MENLFKRQEAFYKSLQEAFPLFWRDRAEQQGIYNCIPTAGPGWEQIIWDCSAVIEKELQAIQHLYPKKLLPYPAQIKEKFGQLRFYYDTMVDLPVATRNAINCAINNAEIYSGNICEMCAKSGKIRSTNVDGTARGWIKTLCDDCHKLGK